MVGLLISLLVVVVVVIVAWSFTISFYQCFVCLGCSAHRQLLDVRGELAKTQAAGAMPYAGPGHPRVGTGFVVGHDGNLQDFLFPKNGVPKIMFFEEIGAGKYGITV